MKEFDIAKHLRSVKKSKPREGYLNFIRKQKEIHSLIISDAKKKKYVVYGAVALNKQVSPAFRRNTPDVDVFAPKPKAASDFTQRMLDRKIAHGHNDFYEKPAQHPGTYKVMYIGKDQKRGTADDVGVADYTKPEKKVGTVTVEGQKYQSLKSIHESKLKTLRDKEAAYRHEKDRADLERIKIHRAFKGEKT